MGTCVQSGIAEKETARFNEPGRCDQYVLMPMPSSTQTTCINFA
jgi:hypothetical protein